VFNYDVEEMHGVPLANQLRDLLREADR